VAPALEKSKDHMKRVKITAKMTKINTTHTGTHNEFMSDLK
jgi:hypothetical protein